MSRRGVALVAAALSTSTLAGCGLAVAAPDLFALTRTGQGKPLSIVVNDGGTVRCDGGPAKTMPDRLLLVARDLVVALGLYAQRKLDLPSAPGSVYRFQVRLQAGTIAFPDTAAGHRAALAQLEQFVLQAQALCAGGG